MSVDLLKYAFVAGELSDTLLGRTDYEKYDFGLAEAENWFVDYRGGLSTRPGTEFVDFLDPADTTVKLVPFRYAPNLANTYIVVFGRDYIRFLQDGAYVLEGIKTITDITASASGVVTSTAHGYTAGDWVYLSSIGGMTELNNRLFMVGATTANTFVLRYIQAINVNTTNLTPYTSGGTVRRVYTLVSPYFPGQLADLQFTQRRDYLRLTHPAFITKNLIRTGHTNWALENENLNIPVTRPTIISGGTSGAGSAEAGFVVTAVFEDGTESIGSFMHIQTGQNYSVTQGWMAIKWSLVTDAVYYNIYRTNIINSGGDGIHGGVSKGEQAGFIGRAFGNSFSDPNITPDFARSPPLFYNPFAEGAIRQVNVTNSGTGYTESTTVTMSGGGTGFIGFPVVTKDGAIGGVIVQAGGRNYVNPAITFVGAGTGAAATVDVSEQSGNFPTVSAIFQQRQYYAATDNQPMTIFASQPGIYDNFSFGTVVVDSDSFEFDIESQEVSPILHLVDVRGGLLVMSETGIWLLRAGSSAGSAITASDHIADFQSARGSSRVKPLPLDNDLLYVEGKSPTVRILSYSELSKGFGGQDMSILSNHLFGADKEIVRWDFAQNPHNLVYAVREDGILLTFTYVKEQDVYAWTPAETRGQFRDITVVNENGRDIAYFVVEREINGEKKLFIERFASRTFKRVEDAWAVDCGLAYAPVYPDGDLSASAATGNVTLTRSNNTFFFGAGAVGQIVRMGGGKAEVTAFTNGYVVQATILEPITDLVHDTAIPKKALEGMWSIDPPFTVLSGLHHLEGETVQVLADGDVLTPKTVLSGKITLSTPATRAVVGLRFVATARTLPLSAGDANIEHRRKSIVGTAVRVHDTRGLKQGSTLDKLYEMKERTDEPYGQATRLQTGFKYGLIESHFDDNGQIYFVQEHPLPATILGLVTDIDVGDDPDDRIPRR